MALTEVITYLNDRLHSLHPASRLGREAHLGFRNGRLVAEWGGRQYEPLLRPVWDTVKGRIVARSSHLAEAGDGTVVALKSVRQEQLFLQAWDAEDVIFLDRFLRTLHALNYLQSGYPETERLVVGVHLRHVSAVPEHHGEVFEGLLAKLGLRPEQILLRLSGPALCEDDHVIAAAASFRRRGYGLVASFARPLSEAGDVFAGLGVHGVVLPADQILRDSIGDELAFAFATRFHLWVDRIDTSEGLDAARAAGAHYIEGGYIEQALKRGVELKCPARP